MANMETDVLGKYVRRCLCVQGRDSSDRQDEDRARPGISMEFLAQHGFV